MMAKTTHGALSGTFDPVTLGHLDIVKRAVKLVDHLVIGVATNPSKSPMFTLDERMEMVRHEADAARRRGRATIDVKTFDSLLMQFAEEDGRVASSSAGLRAVSDFEYEFQMVAMNQRLNPEIETVFLMADPRHQAIASRLVKEIAMLGGNVAPFTTPYVAEMLVAALRRKEEERLNGSPIRKIRSS